MLSIVIPTYNEEQNIIPLIESIHDTCEKRKIVYEIIIIDDNSLDSTADICKSLTKKYPLRLFQKIGKKGKSYSLLQGFSYATYEIICMIDADLQYPPEAILRMIDKINCGFDIVIANRDKKNISPIRKILSKYFQFFFAKILHNMDHDVQSGLKLFKKEIIQRIEIKPSPWTFDLPFLVKARDAGYAIAGIEITFEERMQGKSKVNPLKTSYEIGLYALKTKIEPATIIPFHSEVEKKEGKGFHFKGKKFIHHSRLDLMETAFFRLSRGQIYVFFLLTMLLLMSFLLNWHTTLLVLLALLMLLYFVDLFFNLFLIIQSFRKTPDIKINKKELHEPSNDTWPMYTILCPLYKEWNVIPQFVAAINKLDYPKEKLQVMLILEEDDKESVKKIKEYALPPYFEINVVNDSFPKTKPKACNYALYKAKGEYCVIFDAEDVPEPEQLKKAVLAFQKSSENTICLQAKLNFYNPHHNILTRVFTAEYSLWFDLLLTGLQSINAPIPLGGTSNHFKTKDLINLKGWDAFNVTEDCDLGMRLIKYGYKTAIIDSTTYEEANSHLGNWFGQRSRWIKGYIQTYFVHMRNPKAFIKDWKKPDFLTFQLIVGGKILSMLVNPLLWAITIAFFAFRPFIGDFIESFFPAPILYTAVFSAVVGNFLYLYYYMIGCAKRGYFDIIKFGFLIPAYWMMMSVATWYALYKIITQPHYWFKTKHGLHLSNDKATHQATNVIGRDLVDTIFKGISFT